MAQADDRALVRQATDHLSQALAILDDLQLHVAAAQCNQVIEMVQDRSESDLGR